MNAERLERMCSEVINNKLLHPKEQVALIALYLKEYREWAERQLS